MDITKVAGVGVDFTVNGKSYLVMPIRVSQVAELVAWARSKLPNPIEVVTRGFNSPEAKARDLEATLAIRRHRQEQNRLAAQQPPLAPGELPQPDEQLAALAELAEEWKDTKRRLMLQAYDDAYGAGPQLGGDRLSPIVNSMEGIAFDLWLGLRQHHVEEFPTHEAVLELFDAHPEEMLRAYRRVRAVNEADPKASTPPTPGAQAATGELIGASSAPN